jgi:zinc finger SWIM domain-containing protein 3
MVADYEVFGDVVCFDTTYRKLNDGRPFGLLVGVNNHKKTTIFGAALLYDETAESFVWLFYTFLTAMSGKKPQTILTDEDAAMAKAIKIALPETHHRICIWHMKQMRASTLLELWRTIRSSIKIFKTVFMIKRRRRIL